MKPSKRNRCRCNNHFIPFGSTSDLVNMVLMFLILDPVNLVVCSCIGPLTNKRHLFNQLQCNYSEIWTQKRIMEAHRVREVLLLFPFLFDQT